MSRRTLPTLELESLPTSARHAVEAALSGASVEVTRHGQALGTLDGRPTVLTGTVVAPAPAAEKEEETPREGVTVVATAMALSDDARARLSKEFGEDFVVLDLRDAPESAEVILAPPVSPQLIGSLQAMFPDSRVVITEIHDPDLGVDYSGPVSRLLDAGAAAYLPPRPLDQVATNLRAYLTRSEASALTSGGEAVTRAELPR